jgi:hypothetical protein
MAAGHVTVPLHAGSDGDPTHRPTGQSYTQISPPTLYLDKIGQQWVESRGEALPGIKYSLERLPAGYTLWHRPRPKDPAHFDKYLYGHPGHQLFDSPNRFFPHFKYLMENAGNGIGCPCTVCSGKGGVLPLPRAAKKASQNGSSGTSTPKITAPQQKGRLKLVPPGIDVGRVDEEGTPDIYRNLIDRLQKQGTLDETIEEPMSMDWRAEQELLPKTLQEFREKPQWLPRVGDIVLYVRELPTGVEICRDKFSGEFRLLDVETDRWIGHPLWKAGLIGQTPTETTDIEDLVEEHNKTKNVSYSGVRVEPLPSPNNTDKSLSKRYKYIPVHYTRPFVFWKDLLRARPEEEWDHTVKNTLTAISSFSLMGKYRFRGAWPTAQIYCHGLFLGTETLAIGDTVRLVPKPGQDSCTDVLTITSIRLRLTNLNIANGNDYDEGRPYNSSVQIFGRAYTSEVSRSSKEWHSIDHPLPSIIRKRDPWRHPLHPADKEMTIPLSRILGRLFESDAMTLWFPPPSLDSLESPNLSQGLEGLLEARAFSRKNDKRITEHFGATWYWADTRAECLDLRTVNGLELSKFDNERDTKEWRKQIKAEENLKAMAQSQAAHEQARAIQRSLRDFAAPAPTMKQKKFPRRNRSEGSSVSASLSGTGTTTTTYPNAGIVNRAVSRAESMSRIESGNGQGRKRNNVIDLSSEDEEQIRQHTRIVQEKGKESKKAKVRVVID